ncbi:hypothetical protein D3C80_1983020 [compost metagenome]
MKNSIPRIISRPRIKIMIEPAIAKEETSSPINFRISLPARKKRIINAPDTTVAVNALISPIFFLIPISTGIDPSISITANSVIDMVTISLILIWPNSFIAQK